MTLKGHKNLIANGATATGLSCWQMRAAVSFGLNPNTPATSFTLRGRDQFASLVERLGGDYSLEKQ